MLRPLELPHSTYRVMKTGLPFYDANRLIGAMHAFFGAATREAWDRGAFYEISGPRVGLVPDQVARVADRLRNRGLERVDNALAAVDGLDKKALEELAAYFSRTEALAKVERGTMSRYLEPAYLSGARGSDATNYGVLASERGASMDPPLPEILVATLGVTFSAIAYGGDDRLLLLPVLDLSGGRPTTLGPFIEFNRSFTHKAGGTVAAVSLSLGILDALASRVPVADIAYARFGGRVFYQSGLLGLHRLCRSWSDRPALLAEAADYFQVTARRDDPALNEVARTLAQFLANPHLKSLEAIARVKARALAVSPNTPLARLLAHPNSITEALKMADTAPPKVRDTIPQPSEALIEGLGLVFRTGEVWIGRYVQLERASRPDRFFEEIQKILSRAMAGAKQSDDRRWLYARLRDALDSLTSNDVLEISQPGHERHFRAYKAAFLLRLLGSLKYQGRSTGPAAPAQQRPAGPEATDPDTITEEGNA